MAFVRDDNIVYIYYTFLFGSVCTKSAYFPNTYFLLRYNAFFFIRTLAPRVNLYLTEKWDFFLPDPSHQKKDIFYDDLFIKKKMYA